MLSSCLALINLAVVDMINVLIVDDHKIVRESLKLILADFDTLDVVAEAADGTQALEILSAGLERIDIVLTDNQMPVMDGIMMTQHISSNYVSVKVVMLSMVDNEREIARAFAAGINGYLLKTVQPAELAFCISHVQEGGNYLSSNLVTRFLSFMQQSNDKALPAIDVSDRERTILMLISKGYTNSAIADQLFLGKRNVESIRQELMVKTGSKNSAALVNFVVTNRLI